MKVTEFTIMGFLAIALIFTSNNEFSDKDLIDCLTDYVDAKTYILKTEANAR